MAKNPANESGTLEDSLGFKRIPMTAPTRKLEVPEIEGYKMYWFRGEPGRLQRAINAGYEFVKPEEVNIHNHEIAGDLDMPGHTDMGDRVSVAAQDGVGENGQYLRLYLMKIKLEWWTADQELYEVEKTDKLLQALNAGVIGVEQSPGDPGNRYVKRNALPEMFKKKSNSVRT